jgi:hypothetical protein
MKGMEEKIEPDHPYSRPNQFEFENSCCILNDREARAEGRTMDVLRVLGDHWIDSTSSS